MSTRRTAILVMLWIGLGSGGGVWAQTVGEHEPPPAVELPADLMTPTRHGLRMTPDLARIFSRRWLQEDLGKDVSLNERQEDELSRRVADRLTDMAANHGEQASDLIEFSIESMLEMRGRAFTPEMSQQFAERTEGLLPVVRNFMQDFARDARPLLSDKQWEQLKERLRGDFRRVDRLEEVMKRWADGDVKEGEDIFRTLAEIDEEEGGSGAQGRSPRGRPALRRAHRRAEDDLRRLSPTNWAAYVQETSRFFEFTAEQTAEAGRILAEYRGRAEALMTASWRERCRENRMKYHLRWSLGREPLAPWIYHLEREYQELIAPVSELDHRFRDEVLALATDEQRAAGVQTLRERSEAHGMDLDDLDMQMLGLGRR